MDTKKIKKLKQEIDEAGVIVECLDSEDTVCITACPKFVFCWAKK